MLTTRHVKDNIEMVGVILIEMMERIEDLEKKTGIGGVTLEED